jgi:hypothetical protein
MKESFIEIYKELKDAQSRRKEAEKDEKLLKEKLRALIPDNQEKGGIYHKVTYSNSVSYAKAFPEIKSLIPKTKHEEADKILESFTTAYPRHTFKEV